MTSFTLNGYIATEQTPGSWRVLTPTGVVHYIQGSETSVRNQISNMIPEGVGFYPLKTANVYSTTGDPNYVNNTLWAFNEDRNARRAAHLPDFIPQVEKDFYLQVVGQDQLNALAANVEAYNATLPQKRSDLGLTPLAASAFKPTGNTWPHLA